MKPSKYRSVRTTVDGVTFDSRREAKHWQDLKLLERGGKISQLERQVSFVLAPAVNLAGEARKKPALRYMADFRYFDPSKGSFVVADAKGRETPVSRIKRHLMATVHGIQVVLL